MGDFRKENIPQTDFEGKKFLQGNIWREKMLPEKRYLSWRIMLEKILTPLYVKKKNSITRGLGKVKSLPKPNVRYIFVLAHKDSQKTCTS